MYRLHKYRAVRDVRRGALLERCAARGLRAEQPALLCADGGFAQPAAHPMCRGAGLAHGGRSRSSGPRSRTRQRAFSSDTSLRCGVWRQGTFADSMSIQLSCRPARPRLLESAVPLTARSGLCQSSKLAAPQLSDPPAWIHNAVAEFASVQPFGVPPTTGAVPAPA